MNGSQVCSKVPLNETIGSQVSGNDRTGFFSAEPNRTEFEKLFTVPNRTEPNRISVTEPNPSEPYQTFPV